jgi:hypothetical protein
MLLPPPSGEHFIQWENRKEGLRRFAKEGWHDNAIAKGWTLDELYGTPGVAWHIIDQKVLYVDARLISVMDRWRFGTALYRDCDYWE